MSAELSNGARRARVALPNAPRPTEGSRAEVVETMTGMSQLIIIGGGGHALAVADAAKSSGWEIEGFLAQEAPKQRMLGGNWLQSLGSLDLTKFWLALAVGNNAKRKKACLDILEEFPHARLATVIHKSACVSPSVTIGRGAVVLSQANIGAFCSVGVGAIVNSSSNLEHESSLNDFSSLGPGATTGGNTHIGELTEIGIGVSVLPGVTIGPKSVVGASSMVNRDIPAGSLAYGNPCRVVKLIPTD